jgi:hypothetical protein
LIAALAASLAFPIVVHAWGIIPTAGLVVAVTVALKIGRGRGSPNGNRAV